jgi:hypothetical protein
VAMEVPLSLLERIPRNVHTFHIHVHAWNKPGRLESEVGDLPIGDCCPNPRESTR